MSKLLVTHKNPDPDAITSVWLFRRFDQAYDKAGVAFVSAGKTYKDQPADSDPKITHVDTGMGEFDHHQTDERTCAAKIVLEHLQRKYEYLQDDEALDRLVEVVVGDDHFDECYWPEPMHDRYNFMLGEVLHGLKHNNTLTDMGLIDLGSTCLDGIYTSLKLKIDAEQELARGQQFNSVWGKGIGLESKNDMVLSVGQKQGYIVVVRKDPENGMVRIKAQPRSDADLTQAHAQLTTLDPKATWFLHASKKMLLNGSYKNPDSVYTTLPLNKIIKVLST